MKLFLVKKKEKLPDQKDPWSPWYEKSYGFVIRAENESKAREIATEETSDEDYGGLKPWLSGEYSDCTELTQEGPEEIIIQDFSSA